MINCPECGQELPDGTRFCTSCGQPCNRSAMKAQRRSQMNVAETMPAESLNMPRPSQPSISSAPTAQFTPAQQGFTSAPTAQFTPAQSQQQGYAQATYASQPHTGRTAEAFVPAYAPQTAQQASAAATATGANSDQQAKRRRTIIMASVLAAVLIVAVVAVAAWASGANKQAADNAKHADRTITFQLEAPDYDEDTDSPIPVRVSGTNLDGAQVEETFYITPDEPKIQLQQGSYTASVAASSMLSDGTLYKIPEELIDLQVRDQNLSGDGLGWSFTAMDPVDITDEQIDAAYQSALDSGMDSEKADSLRQAVLDSRQAALDKKAADEQAEANRRAAEAEAQANAEAAAAANHFDDGYVSLDVPSTWIGNYTSSTDGHTSGVFHTDFYLAGSNFMLLRIDGVYGDLNSYSATYTNAATEIWDSAHVGSPYSDADLDFALYLQTGGSLTRADVLACGSGGEAEALGEQYIGYFMDNNIAPTVGVG